MKHYLRIKTFALAVTFLCVAAISPVTATAIPVSVDYTVAGSTGDWILDFSFTNNITAPTDMSLYQFGVSIDAGSILAHDIAGTPQGFLPYGTTWTNVLNGGSSTIYNNSWRNPTVNQIFPNANTIFPGNTLSGFQVHVTDLTAPTSVLFYAYGWSTSVGQYTGGDNFNNEFSGSGQNPYFQGVAQGSVPAVPEPSSLLLLGAGLVGLAAWRWKHAA